MITACGGGGGGGGEERRDTTLEVYINNFLFRCVYIFLSECLMHEN